MTAQLKASLGYLLAIVLIPLALAVFIGLNDWAKLLASSSGLRISPWFSGGEVIQTRARPGHEMRIHKPVFDALVGERSKGFVQIDWAPKSSVPAKIDETIDIDGDGKADLRVLWNIRADKIELESLAPWVTGLEGHYELSKRYTIRVGLLNQRNR